MSAVAGNGPRLGVTLFSYTREYFLGAMSLADCLQAVGRLEGRGLELVGAQSLRGYPRPNSETIHQTRALIERYELEPVSYGAYVERGRRAGHVAGLKESVDAIEAELGIAKQLGFPILRLNTGTPELLSRLLPAAERTGITIAVELHQGTIESPEMQALLDLFERAASPHLGFLQDLGAMMVKLPASFLGKARRSGIAAEIVTAVEASWVAGCSREETLQRVADLGGGPRAAAWANAAHSMFLRTSPATLHMTLPHLVHVHGKFFGIDDRGEDPCIPYRAILAVLHEAAYGGVIASEYLSWEPLTRLDAVTQVAAHHRMIRRLWDELSRPTVGKTTEHRRVRC